MSVFIKMHKDGINPVQRSPYHDSKCPDSLRRQVIRSHDIDYVE